MVGFISHAFTDYIRPQHYNFDLFNPKGNIDIILFESVVCTIQFFNANEKQRYAIVGSLAPDIIEATFVINDKSRWYKGNHIFPWHKKSNPKQLSKEETILLSVSLFSVSF